MTAVGVDSVSTEFAVAGPQDVRMRIDKRMIVALSGGATAPQAKRLFCRVRFVFCFALLSIRSARINLFLME
jgi:hypothetical protein